MHHKTSDSVEIQEIEFPENARKNKFEKKKFSYFPQWTNTDEFGRNPKKRTACFPQYEFLCGRIRTSFCSFRIFQEFGKIGKITEK